MTPGNRRRQPKPRPRRTAQGNRQPARPKRTRLGNRLPPRSPKVRRLRPASRLQALPRAHPTRFSPRMPARQERPPNPNPKRSGQPMRPQSPPPGLGPPTPSIAAVPSTPRFFRRSPDRRRSQYRGEDRQRREAASPAPMIADLLKEGQEILVQIAKEPLGNKGARITSHIAIPGRYLVYMPTVNHIGVSRKISSGEERQRLRKIIQDTPRGSAGRVHRSYGRGVQGKRTNSRPTSVFFAPSGRRSRPSPTRSPPPPSSTGN